MKKFKRLFSMILLFSGLLGFLSGCGAEKSSNKNFTEETLTALKKKAKLYTEEEFQNGEVPLHDFVQLTGKITKTDGKSSEIQKGDRFILESGKSRYQIFNQQEEIFVVGDEVTVYGEYYGFITASYVEKK